MTWFLHIANLVYLYSYTIKDMKRLRMVSIFANLLCIPYYLSWGRYEAVAWTSVFVGIHAYRLHACIKCGDHG